MTDRVLPDHGGWISGPMMDPDELALEDVRRKFPDWTVYRGTDQRWHARPADAAPPVIPVAGDDLLDLKEEIERYLARAAENEHIRRERRDQD